MTYTDDSSNIFSDITCDKTYTEIVEANTSGKVVYAKLLNTKSNFILLNSLFLFYVDSSYVNFSAVIGDTNYYNLYSINVNSDNSVSGNHRVLDSASLAYINSPEFTGTPSAPTPETTDNSTKIATTAYVNALIESVIIGGSW